MGEGEKLNHFIASKHKTKVRFMLNMNLDAYFIFLFSVLHVINV